MVKINRAVKKESRGTMSGDRHISLMLVLLVSFIVLINLMASFVNAASVCKNSGDVLGIPFSSAGEPKESQTEAKASCNAPANSQCAGPFANTKDLKEPPTESTSTQTNAQTNQTTTVTKYSYQCRSVCKSSSGSCLDKEGFDTENKFKPKTGVVKDGGNIPEYANGRIFCEANNKCKFTTVDRISFDVESGEMNVDEGALYFFNGKILSEAEVEEVSVKGDVKFDLTKLDDSWFKGDKVVEGAKFKVEARNAEINGAKIENGLIVIGSSNVLNLRALNDPGQLIIDGLKVKNGGWGSYNTEEDLLELAAGSRINSYQEAKDGLKITGEGVLIYHGASDYAWLTLESGTLIVNNKCNIAPSASTSSTSSTGTPTTSSSSGCKVSLVSDPDDPATVNGKSVSKIVMGQPLEATEIIEDADDATSDTARVASGFVSGAGLGGSGESYGGGSGGIAGTGSDCYSKGSITKIARITTSGKCFVTVDGEPFFPIADTAWLLYRLNDAELDQYMKKRKEQGFNTIKFSMCVQSAEKNFDCSKAWERYDAIFRKLNEHGLYAEPGPNADDPNAQKFVARYKDQPNIWTWIVGGLDDGLSESQVNSLAAYMKEKDTSRLISYHPKSSKTTADYSLSPGPNYIYVHSYSPRTVKSLILGVVGGSQPVYSGEPAYEGPRNDVEAVKSEIRDSVSAGAAGISYGHDSIWMMYKGNNAYAGYSAKVTWDKALDSPGVQAVIDAAKGLGTGGVRGASGTGTGGSEELFCRKITSEDFKGRWGIWDAASPSGHFTTEMLLDMKNKYGASIYFFYKSDELGKVDLKTLKENGFITVKTISDSNAYPYDSAWVEKAVKTPYVDALGFDFERPNTEDQLFEAYDLAHENNKLFVIVPAGDYENYASRTGVSFGELISHSDLINFWWHWTQGSTSYSDKQVSYLNSWKSKDGVEIIGPMLGKNQGGSDSEVINAVSKIKNAGASFVTFFAVSTTVDKWIKGDDDRLLNAFKSTYGSPTSSLCTVKTSISTATSASTSKSSTTSSSCKVIQFPTSGQIQDKVGDISLVGGKSTLTAYQSGAGYSSGNWMMFHSNSYVELQGTGVLLLRWEYEGAHRPEGAGEQRTPIIEGDISYMGDAPSESKYASHYWPGSSSRDLYFCLNGKAKIVDREATGGYPGWYNIVVFAMTPGCANNLQTVKATSYTGPINQNIVNKCKSLAGSSVTGSVISPITGNVVSSGTLGAGTSQVAIGSHEITAVLMNPKLSASGSTIMSSLGDSEYHYDNVFYREGNPKKADHFYGAYNTVEYLSNNDLMSLDYDGQFAMGLGNQGSVYVDSSSNIILVETIRETIIRDGDYQFVTSDEMIGLDADYVFSNSDKNKKPIEINPYALKNKDGELYLQYLLHDNSGNTGKVIINSEGEIGILNKKISVNSSGINGNVISWIGIITGNVIRSGEDLLEKQWLSVSDRR